MSLPVYPFQLIATPNQRWCILVTYWLVLALFLYFRGAFRTKIAQTEWKKFTNLHAMLVVVGTSVFFCSWDLDLFTFGRSLSLFSSFVYPLGQILDSMAWLEVFDMGRNASRRVLGKNRVVQFVGGFLLLTFSILCHRFTLERSYLPEHHPPLEFWISFDFSMAIGPVVGALFAAVYHWTGDVRFCILCRYVQDLYFCTQMRLPAPWMEYNNEHVRHLWKFEREFHATYK